MNQGLVQNALLVRVKKLEKQYRELEDRIKQLESEVRRLTRQCE